MACRCIDKQKCNRDILKLNEIKILLTEIQNKNFDISMELNNFSRNCNNTFASANMIEFNSEVKKLDDFIEESLPVITSKCNEKITLLQTTYNSLTTEDEQYHSGT